MAEKEVCVSMNKHIKRIDVQVVGINEQPMLFATPVVLPSIEIPDTRVVNFLTYFNRWSGWKTSLELLLKPDHTGRDRYAAFFLRSFRQNYRMEISVIFKASPVVVFFKSFVEKMPLTIPADLCKEPPVATIDFTVLEMRDSENSII